MLFANDVLTEMKLQVPHQNSSGEFALYLSLLSKVLIDMFTSIAFRKKRLLFAIFFHILFDREKLILGTPCT